MAENSLFWTTNNTGDGPSAGYSMANWNTIFSDFFLSNILATGGVLKLVGNELACTGVATPIAVNTGSAVVYGYQYRNTASVNLAVTTPVVGLTGGHVILRVNWAAQTVRLVAVRNTDGVAALPSLTQTPGTTYEIRLCSFTITTGGVITITDARVFAKFSTEIVTAMLVDLAVTTAKLADNAVTTVKITDANVTSAKLATGAVTAGKIAAGGISAASQHAAGTVDSTALAALAVTAGKIATGGINLAAQFAAGVVDAAALASNAVTTVKVLNDAIDATKIGNNVLRITSRQGFSATRWDQAGATPQTVSMVNGFAGSAAVTGSLAIVFPSPFAFHPIVFVSISGASYLIVARANSVTASGFTINCTDASTGFPDGSSRTVFWFAFGTE